MTTLIFKVGAVLQDRLQAGDDVGDVAATDLIEHPDVDDLRFWRDAQIAIGVATPTIDGAGDMGAVAPRVLELFELVALIAVPLFTLVVPRDDVDSVVDIDIVVIDAGIQHRDREVSAGHEDSAAVSTGQIGSLLGRERGGLKWRVDRHEAHAVALSQAVECLGRNSQGLHLEVLVVVLLLGS